jgi:hypothetical protein
MKVKYNIKSLRGEYEQDKKFTFGIEYKVIADYRKRQSRQTIRDNGFVVIDNQGNENMLFLNQVEIIEDGEKCFIFSYN